ncbi:MAG: hypothetical protein HOP14_11035 [Acidobacteria bacterium]|nr:hypothetical protein [Acidobacteriota bacterium]
MTNWLGCERARDLLEPLLDGALSMEEQVAVEVHLRSCAVCAARLEDLQTIGVCLRAVGRAGQADDGAAPGQLATLQSRVLMRIGAEREQALGPRLRLLCQDARLFWPAVGATTALLACAVAAALVLRATNVQRPDSLADVIELMANPGSDRNPMPLGAGMQAPRALNLGLVLESIPADEAVFAVAAVVTREGRVSGYQLLHLDSATAGRNGSTAPGADVSNLLDAVGQSRFSPAQHRDGGAVAVNMVWVVARTVVRGQAQAPGPVLDGARRGSEPATEPGGPVV